MNSSSLIPKSAPFIRNFSLIVNKILLSKHSLNVDLVPAIGEMKRNKVWTLPSRSSRFRRRGRTQPRLSMFGARLLAEEGEKERERRKL